MVPERNPARLCPEWARLGPVAWLVAALCLVLLWAHWCDPFARDWFRLRTADGARFDCVLVTSKAGFRPGAPAVIYCHGSGGTLAGSGNDIRQLAEAGCAVLAIEYNQTNFSQFTAQVAVAQGWLADQSWVNTNRIVWAGMSLGGAAVAFPGVATSGAQARAAGPDRGRYDSGTGGRPRNGKAIRRAGALRAA